MYTLTFMDNSFIKCSGKHLFLTDIGFQKTKDIKIGQSLTGKLVSTIDINIGNFEVFDDAVQRGSDFGVMGHIYKGK